MPKISQIDEVPCQAEVRILQKITLKKTDRKMVQELNYQGVEFPVATKHYGKIEEQNSINVNVSGHENEQCYPIYASKQKNEKVLNLLLISKGAKRHYVLIKDFNRMMYNKTKQQHRNSFACTVSSVLALKKY